MARKPATLTRMTGATPVIPSRGHRAPRTSSFPLLPALAATLLLLGFGQTALWWWSGRLPGVPVSLRLPGQAVISATPTAMSAQRTVPHQRLEAPPLEQNVQFGDAMGRVRVTYFTDPACGPCRARVERLSAALPVQGVRQVYKFWPQESGRTTPGLLVELARREAVLPVYWKLLQAQGERDLDDTYLLQLLEKAGLPLAQQRSALSQNSAELYGALVPDLATGRTAELPPPPVVVVDNQILDSTRLTPRQFAEAVQKKLEGRQLTREDRLWMMSR